MATETVHEAVGFSQYGGRIIATVAATVYPPEWASTITNRLDKPMWATVSLVGPEQAAYTENVYYADAALEGGEFWWARKLRAVLAKARHQIRLQREGEMALFRTMSRDRDDHDRIHILAGLPKLDRTLGLDAAA